MRVYCFPDEKFIDGKEGIRAAREKAEDLNVTWNGMGSVIQKTRDAGTYS